MIHDFPEVLSNELLPDEQVVWSGRPDTSIIFHKEDWLAIPFSFMWGGFAIFWLLGASGLLALNSDDAPSGEFHWFGVVWGTPFVLAGQYLIWGRFVYSRWLKGRTWYALTNKRAIVVQHGISGRSCTSAHFVATPMIDKYVRSDGKGAISFGGPHSTQWQFGRASAPRPLTFDDLPDVASPHKIALSLFEKSRKND